MKKRLFLIAVMMLLLVPGVGFADDYWVPLDVFPPQESPDNYLLSLASYNGRVCVGGNGVGSDLGAAVLCGLEYRNWEVVCRPPGADVAQVLRSSQQGLLIGTVPGKALYVYHADGTCTPTEELGDITGVYSLIRFYWFGEHIVAGTSPEGRIFQSDDGGTTWWDRGVPDLYAHVYTLALDDAFNVYAGTSHGGVYRSLYGSSEWTKMGEMPGVEIVHKLLFINGDRLLAATGHNGQIYVSDDYGETWSLNFDHEGISEVMSLAESPSGDRLLAGTYPNAEVFQYCPYWEPYWKNTGHLRSGPDEYKHFVFDLIAVYKPDEGAYRFWACTGPVGKVFFSQRFWLDPPDDPPVMPRHR